LAARELADELRDNEKVRKLVVRAATQQASVKDWRDFDVTMSDAESLAAIE
jgi:hypothetical protein